MRRLDAAVLARRIEARAAEDIAAGNISGAAVAVWQDGCEVFCGHFGTRAPESEEALTAGTVFRLASMTKPITAALILSLADRALLSLDDPVCRYLSYFDSPFIMDEGGERVAVEEKITLRQLLSHSSGIVNVREEGMSERERTEVGGYAEAVARTPLSYRPGTKQAYSPTAAFGVLGAVAEAVTGVPFAALLKREILDPLGMRDTTFSPTEEGWARMVGMHAKKDGKSVKAATRAGCVFGNTPPSLAAGGAGLASTLSDYLAFAEMLRRGGVGVNGRRILSEEAVRAMQTPPYPFVMDSYGGVWGLGVRVIFPRETAILPIGSFGWSGAYGTHFWVDPANGIVAVYLKNSQYDGGSEARTARNFEADVMASFEA